MNYPLRASVVRAALAALPLAVLLTACGGSSESDTVAAATPSSPASPSTPAAPSAPSTPTAPVIATTLSGTAATGAPIAGRVVAIDVNGVVSPPASTSVVGAFVLDVSGMTGPFILSVLGTANGQQVALTSVATAAGQTVNITPLTDLIVSTAAGRPAGTTLVNLCQPTVTAQCKAALASATSGANLDAAVQSVSTMVAPLNTAGTNPLTGAFQANGTGLDRLLDQILVSPATAQGGIATVTLVATKTQLGSVTLAASAGATATTQATAPSATDLTQSSAGATALNEIKSCVASFNNVIAVAAPVSADVGAFFDPAFQTGTMLKADIVSALVGPMAGTGLAMNVAGLSPYDMAPLTSAEFTQLAGSPTPVNAVAVIKGRATSALALDSGGNPVSAWVRMRVTADAGIANWKFTKGAAYAGCPGGWRAAGNSHLEMHMNSRINRSLDSAGGATFTREFAVHTEMDAVTAVNPLIAAIVIRGPGIAQYRGAALPPDASQRVVLRKLTNGAVTNWRIGAGNSWYGNDREALRSCQDLAASAVADPGANSDFTLASYFPCVDETQVAPGRLYSWELKTGGAGGTVVQAFAFQIGAVPMSTAFTQANAADLFATITSTTPATLAALNAALPGLAGAPMDGLVSYNYTQGTVYGSRMDNCGLRLFQGGALVREAEQNAFGKQTSCTFTTAGLNSGSLQAPTGAVNGASIGVTTLVLGNQASSSQPFKP